MLKKKILIIDDEEDLCDMLKMNLESTGFYDVLTESKSLRGYEAAKSFLPDLIILDIIMLGLDGPSVAAQIRADDEIKNIPIVFLTAVVSREEIAAKSSLEAGGERFIPKPVRLPELLDYITQILG